VVIRVQMYGILSILLVVATPLKRPYNILGQFQSFTGRLTEVQYRRYFAFYKESVTDLANYDSGAAYEKSDKYTSPTTAH